MPFVVSKDDDEIVNIVSVDDSDAAEILRKEFRQRSPFLTHSVAEDHPDTAAEPGHDSDNK